MYLKNKLILLIISLFFYHSAKASDPFPVLEAIKATVHGITAKGPPESKYKKNLRPIRYTSDASAIKGCSLIKKISLTNEEFIELPKKSCDEMIQRMSYDKTYTAKNIIYFEYIPLECTPQNLTGQLFNCE
ncbi:MAG: hypothetical protein K2Q18_11250 [Bdellovibrionales bacterium]|nr:hypothetical protein [Bdellovibrionales bacterium]